MFNTETSDGLPETQAAAAAPAAKPARKRTSKPKAKAKTPSKRKTSKPIKKGLVRRGRKTFGTFDPSKKILLLKDKKGVPYGKANNPKRDGSEAAKRFRLYNTGMSVEAYIKKGGVPNDIRWDTMQKFIRVA